MAEPSPPDAVRVDALLREARTRIDAVDAEPLLMHAAGVSRTWLFAHGDRPLPAPVAARFRALVERRAA
ncbi:MAG TPA: protein-(glutamine-N5) methyltransferase, release factor-specific, partial [Lysobacter sp.]